MPQKAADYGLEAGRSSFGRSAAAEAAVHLQRALDLLSRLPEDEVADGWNWTFRSPWDTP